MATLQSMPAELKLCIAEILDMDDSFYFAMISKDNWQLCEPIISRHKALCEKYGSVWTHANEHTLWNILNDILDKPYVADYVVDMGIDALRGECYDPDVNWYDSYMSKIRPPPDDIVRYIRAAGDNPFLTDFADGSTGNTEEALHQSIEFGEDGAIIPTVLSLLPNLKTFSFVARGEGLWFRRALKNIGTAYAKPKPNLNLPFQHLRKVQISHYDTELCMNWEWALLFVRIPSLEFFSGHMVGGEYENGDILAQAPTSNVKRLYFSLSSIAAANQSAILRQMKNLKSFEYENGGGSISYASYDPRGIISALVQYCAHSLERLVLEDDDWQRAEEEEEGPHPVCPPRGLRKLKILRCALSDLIPGDSEDINMGNDKPLSQGFYSAETDVHRNPAFDPAALFPPSLERLQIDGDYSSITEVEKYSMLDVLLKAKNDSLPNLVQLYMSMENASSAELASFKTRASEQGIAFKPIERKTTDIFYGGGY